MKNFIQGQPVRIRTTFKDFDRVLADPSTVTFSIKSQSDGNWTEYSTADEDSSVVHDSTGVYHVDIDTTPESGEWRWRVVGTGVTSSAAQGEFYVKPADPDTSAIVDGFTRRSIIDLADYHPARNGVTDDYTPISNFLNDVMASRNRLGIMGYGAYGIGTALPKITVPGVKIWGAGIPVLEAGIPVGGTLLKAVGSMTGNIMEVGPIEDSSHYLLFHNEITGIGFSANSRADRGLMVKSVRNGKFDLLVYGDPGVTGVEFNVATTLAGTKDTQWNEIKIVGFITNDASAFITDGEEGVANTSYNHFLMVNVYSTDGPGHFGGHSSDTNFYHHESYFVGGSATYAAEYSAGTQAYEGTRGDHHYFFAANKPAVARDGVSPADRIMMTLDRGNGTPEPVREAGDWQIYFDYNWTPKYPGEWVTYTPTITSTGSPPTTVTKSGKYKMGPNSMELIIDLTLTNVGPATGEVIATIPNNMPVGYRGEMSGHVEPAASGFAHVWGHIPENYQVVGIQRTDGLPIWVNGNVIHIHGTIPFDSDTAH